MMAVCCLIMANIPTYAQIGITASWIMILCRIVQGMSSMGEIIGDQIYLTELVKPPTRYSIVSLMGCASCFGTMLALGAATAILSLGLGWRIAFWFGALIAVVGFVARTSLREAPDFIKAKLLLDKNIYIKEKINKKTVIAYFLIQCARPVCMYFCYIYCGDLLKNLFFYTSAQVIQHNFVIAVVDFIGVVFFTYLSSRAVMYIITSLGMAYLISTIGNYGLLIIFAPITIGFYFAIFHFEHLEKQAAANAK